MLGLLVVVAIAWIIIQVGGSMQNKINTSELPSEGQDATSDFSGGFWDAMGLMALAPYLIGALVVIYLVVQFRNSIGGGRL